MKKLLLILSALSVMVMGGDFEDAIKADTAGDYKKAVALYTKAADQGNASAQAKLGYMYQEGKGVKQDYKKAEALYRKNCDDGNLQGCTMLGFMYLLKGKSKEGFELLEDTANRGDDKLFYLIGEYYEKGTFVERDRKKAIEWYKKAEEKGDARAKDKLGFINELGVNIQNYIFLLGLYLILTVLTFAYPKALQKRNHIVNGILMGFFLVFTEAILIPKGFELSVSSIIDLVISALPDREDPADTLKFIEKLKENFISSIITPVIFFIIGHIAYFFKKISINTFDTLFTGLFSFVIYFDFVLFSVTGLFWHYILFFIAYAIFSFGRIQLFMFFGIKNIVDDKVLVKEYN